MRIIPKPPPLPSSWLHDHVPCWTPDFEVCMRYGADVDEQAKQEIKDLLITFDRTLLVADPRQCEPKK